MDRKKILVFTGNRAEYGLQSPILKVLQKDSYFELKLLVSGAHVEDTFGETMIEIKRDNIDIFDIIKIHADPKNIDYTPKSISNVIDGVSKIIKDQKPDYFLVYADRFESFAACVAATQMNIPTIHLEGGDLTLGGALDDSVRHAMTKLSHFHMTTNDDASNRLIKMGEEPWRVKTVGFTGIDLIKNSEFLKMEETVRKFNLDINRPIILFTQHSITTENNKIDEQFIPSLKALVALSTEKIQVILTFPNNDYGSDKIIRLIKDLNKLNIENNKDFQIFKSLGYKNYYSLLNLAKDKKIKICCVGNSSSGIKETPAFGCPTVNIGSRQLGRLKASNVIDVGYDELEIKDAVKKCFYDLNFREICFTVINPYGIGNAATKVINLIKNFPDTKKLINKKYTY